MLYARNAVRDVCYLLYLQFLFVQVHLVLDKAYLTGIVMHKWVPTYGIHFIFKILGILLAKRAELMPSDPPGHGRYGRTSEFGYGL